MYTCSSGPDKISSQSADAVHMWSSGEGGRGNTNLDNLSFANLEAEVLVGAGVAVKHLKEKRKCVKDTHTHTHTHTHTYTHTHTHMHTHHTHTQIVFGFNQTFPNVLFSNSHPVYFTSTASFFATA